MSKSFDHIIKNALENYMAPHIPDWDMFYDLLQIELDSPLSDDQIDDNSIGDALSGLEYNASAPAWNAFESQLDNLNEEMDQEFDQTVGDALKNIPEETWGVADWTTMSNWLDDLDGELDAEFDNTVGEALENIPESTWKQQHWEMLSSRLDELNDKPRLLLMKVIEAAAILLILLQLSNLYSEYQHNSGRVDYLTGYFDQFFNREVNSTDENKNDIIVPPNSFPSTVDQGVDHVAGKSGEQNKVNVEHLDNNPINQSGINPTNIKVDNQSNQTSKSEVKSVEGQKISMVLPKLPLEKKIFEYSETLNQEGAIPDVDLVHTPRVALPLASPPNLINYDGNSSRLLSSAPSLGTRDIDFLTTKSADSILSSIPTLQIIRPRLNSSMEVGMLADATKVEIKDYFLGSGPYQEPTLNAGLYLRYKIQYQNMFGSLGGDYLQMKYGGTNKNELALVTLPVELGYNVVNLPAFRMYFSGGVAGRFVPVANYSTETFNLATSYDAKSNKKTNGLLNKGPFEINSYLSGRLSMGLDINVNKATSVNLRFSHDIWLKGRGIGYNLDKLKSSHLAIGANFHF